MSGEPFLSRRCRRGVCRRCGTVMDDTEPMAPSPHFFHPRLFGDGKPNPCKNAGQPWSLDDTREVEAFQRKGLRRACKRAGGRA